MTSKATKKPTAKKQKPKAGEVTPEVTYPLFVSGYILMDNYAKPFNATLRTKTPAVTPALVGELTKLLAQNFDVPIKMICLSNFVKLDESEPVSDGK